jgi:signal transduction histidine kinase
MPYSFSPRFTGPRIVLLGVLPALVLLAAFGYLTYGSLRLDQHRILIRRTDEILATARAVESAVQDAERGQRGYLLTDNPRYLIPYTEGLDRLSQAMIQLQRQTPDQPDQQQRILVLQRSLATKLDELARTIDLHQQQGHDAALALINTDIGADAMEAILQHVGEIIDSERTRRDGQLEKLARAQRRIAGLSLAGGGLAILAIGWITFALYRSYRETMRSESTLQATLNSVEEGVSAFDAEHRLVAWNEMFSTLARLSPESIHVGQALSSIDSLNAGDAIGEGLSALDQRARRSGGPLLVEHERSDGTIIELYHSQSADGGFVTTYLDITERKRAENRLHQSQKMESLGKMTGGIAHDFNNLLTVIVGNLELLKGRVGDDSRAQRHVEMALMGADRGAKLTHQLLAFARKQPLVPRAVNLAQILPDLTDMLRRTLGELIEIEIVGSPGLWNVSIDPHQFESAVLNLAINARDAMPNGGKLTLELANIRLDDAYAAQHVEVKAGQYIVFSITDTGAGMPAETVERAFDPFFTTKGEGGTGLGLSMVFGFVKQSGGHIKIYSEPGHGTTVKLYLPRTSDGIPDAYEAKSIGDITGSETILVVEDEDPVRTTVMALVGGLGYRVIEAADGAAALSILEGGAPIDLLFTDVIMPGPVSSRVLAQRARELRPMMKILFTSGYTENTIVHNGRLDAGVQLISKPYGRDQLAQKLRSVLNQPEAM